MLDEGPLPEGITRHMHCSSHVGLDSCRAMCFYYCKKDGTESSLIVWKDMQSNVRPAEQGKRIRDLRPGDEAWALGKPVTLTAVEIYR